MTAGSQSVGPSFFRIARRWSMLVLLLGTLLIALSAIGFWVQWTLISEDAFVELTGGVLTAQDTRETLSRAIVDQIFADFPVLRALVRDPIEAIISGILGSSLFESGIARVAERIWETLFIEGGRIALDISSLRDFLYGVISAIAPERAAAIDPAQFPDELILLEAESLPDMAALSSTISFVTWLALLIGIGLVGLVIGRAWSPEPVRYALIAWTGILLAAEAVLLAIVTIPTRSTVIVAIDNATGRSVVATTFDMLLERLYGLLLVLFIFSVVLIAVGFWMRNDLSLSRLAHKLGLGGPPEQAVPSGPVAVTE